MTDKIDWNDPNLDLDEVLGIPDLDEKEWFIQENKEKTIDLIDLNNIEEIEKKLDLSI